MVRGNKFYINKKGDVSVTIFVIGVIAIVLLALISFAVVGNKAKKVQGAELVEKASSMERDYNFYLGKGYSETETEEILGLDSDSEGVYINISSGDVSVKYYVKR